VQIQHRRQFISPRQQPREASFLIAWQRDPIDMATHEGRISC
jgi:hypothetical protein